MHPYNIKMKNRRGVLKSLAVLAVALATGFNYLIQVLRIPIPWYIDTPTVASFFGIILWIFDKFFWRMRIGPLSIAQIPDLSGTWVGEIHSSYQNMIVPVVIHIRQTWEEMSIELESETSFSRTETAEFNIDGNTLSYTYQNEPKRYGRTPEHKGDACLHLSSDYKKLDGKYFTSKGSHNHGTISLTFLEREIKDYEEALRLAQSKQPAPVQIKP